MLVIKMTKNEQIAPRTVLSISPRLSLFNFLSRKLTIEPIIITGCLIKLNEILISLESLVDVFGGNRSQRISQATAILNSKKGSITWIREGDRIKQQIETQIPPVELHNAFDEMVGFHEEGGVDFLILEMMDIPYRMKSLFNCLSHSKLPVWCGFSAKRKTKKNSEITSFHDEQVSFEQIVKLSLDYKFDVLGIMHTSVDLISDCIDVIKKYHNGPVMAYPDSGYFKSPNWQFSEIITPNDLVDEYVL